MLSRLVITFLPRSKRLFISWLQSPSAVILEPPKINSLIVSAVSPSVCREVMGPNAMILVLWMLSFNLTLIKQNILSKTYFRNKNLNRLTVYSYNMLTDKYYKNINKQKSQLNKVWRPEGRILTPCEESRAQYKEASFLFWARTQTSGKSWILCLITIVLLISFVSL